MRNRLLFVFCFIAQFCFAQSYPVSSYTLDYAVVPNLHAETWNYTQSNFYVYKPANYNPLTSPILFGCYATGANGLDVAGALQPMADARGALIVAAHFVTQINEPVASIIDSLYLNYPIGGYGRDYPATLFYKHIYRRVLEREGRDSIPCYMIGFSAGGQFVSRYMLWRQSYPDSIPLRMAVSCNPYFYTFPTKVYNGVPMDYASGLDMSLGWFNPTGTSPEDSITRKIYNFIGCDEHIKQYYNENYAVLIGTADNATLSDNASAMAQGANRYERAQSFYNFGLADAPNYGTTLNWQYYEIPGIGHDQGGMFYTKEVATHTYSIAEHILFDSPYKKVERIAPLADFVADKTTLTLPNTTVHFTNKSTLATSYFWQFGDGTFSGEVNPCHTYTQKGKYIVQLTAFNDAGCANWMTREFYINVTGTGTYTDACSVTTLTTITDIGIKESAEKLIKLQPNPSIDEVLVSFGDSNATEIEVITITGEVVYKENINNKSELKIATKNWSNGMYFVSVQSNKQKITLKLLVQH
ncbi:MAG: PKD domain-containing protein [Bacteroidota bacterium]